MSEKTDRIVCPESSNYITYHVFMFTLETCHSPHDRVVAAVVVVVAFVVVTVTSTLGQSSRPKNKLQQSSPDLYQSRQSDVGSAIPTPLLVLQKVEQMIERKTVSKANQNNAWSLWQLLLTKSKELLLKHATFHTIQNCV